MSDALTNLQDAIGRLSAEEMHYFSTALGTYTFVHYRSPAGVASPLELVEAVSIPIADGLSEFAANGFPLYEEACTQVQEEGPPPVLECPTCAAVVG